MDTITMATLYASFLCFIILQSSAAGEEIDGGFTVELIPSDSPKSPFYDPLETPYQRAHKAVRRSIMRLAGLGWNAPGHPSADITANEGSYLIKIAIGTPPEEIVATADTGSDLIWTQCKPCHNCFRQDAPMFDPRKSKSYAVISYHSPKCKVFDGTSCSPQGSLCQYHESYADRSYSKGYIATDTISLRSTSRSSIKFVGAVIGCGHDNNGTFNSRTSGIVGLGGGDASLISQIGRSYGSKFSYCLLHSSDTASSKLNFGSRATVSGRGTVSTPLIQKHPKTFYYIYLEGISINGKRFNSSLCPPTHGAGHGNIIVDSGMTVTLLPRDLYEQIEAAVSAAIHHPRVQDPSGSLRLCYQSSQSSENFAPNITVHFTGADAKLNGYHTFIFMAPGVACFAFLPSTCNMVVYGNLAQMNFLIGFDIARGRLSFKPANCSRY